MSRATILRSLDCPSPLEKEGGPKLGREDRSLLSTNGITIAEVIDVDDDLQEVRGADASGAAHRALNYIALSGPINPGDFAVINTTAVKLGLGTGGFDFVISHAPNSDSVRRNVPDWRPESHPGCTPSSTGHIIKARYLPCQVAVDTVEEHPENAGLWDRTLEGMPVLAGQLHSQVIPAAYGLRDAGVSKAAYIMTDAAALPMAFSNTVRTATTRGMIDVTITCGQAFGGDYECVTLHSALLVARHLAQCDAAIVCQGPGNAGTGTRYGYSGIEQAGILDVIERLGGKPVAIVRMSNADMRERHRGISHHTRTTLALAYARCIVPLPVSRIDDAEFAQRGCASPTADRDGIDDRHDLRHCAESRGVLERFRDEGWGVTTMGRGPERDGLFFEAAIAAGIVAGRL